MERGFEQVSYIEEAIIPTRKTHSSAGYDFSILQEIEIKPGKTVICQTGIKAFMHTDEYLAMHIRSSLAIKKGIFLINSTGIIDADYYNNLDNEGHIMVALFNSTDQVVKLEKFERVAQGIFCKYYTTSQTEKTAQRIGGIGSTTI